MVIFVHAAVRSLTYIAHYIHCSFGCGYLRPLNNMHAADIWFVCSRRENGQMHAANHAIGIIVCLFVSPYLVDDSMMCWFNAANCIFSFMTCSVGFFFLFYNSVVHEKTFGYIICRIIHCCQQTIYIYTQHMVFLCKKLIHRLHYSNSLIRVHTADYISVIKISYLQ